MGGSWGEGGIRSQAKQATQPTKRIIIERNAYDTAQQIVKQGQSQQTDKQTDEWMCGQTAGGGRGAREGDREREGSRACLHVTHTQCGARWKFGSF